MKATAQIFIAGEWQTGASGYEVEVLNPATGAAIGAVALAAQENLDRALDAAGNAFPTWGKVSAFERSGMLRQAAQLLRSRARDIARPIVAEQGKPFPEAVTEVIGSADHIDWAAEEGRRSS